jgi:hypothetical protein
VSTVRRCEACDSPLAADQRYCLLCGTRAGGRSPQLDALLTRLRSSAAAGDGADAGAPVSAAAPAVAPVAQRRLARLPSARISTLLILAFGVFGALLGDAGAGRLTAAAPALKVVVPQHRSPVAQTPPTSTGESEPVTPPESEPEAEPEATPAPSSPAPATEPTTSTGEPSGGEGASPSAGTTPAAKTPAKHTAKLSDIKHVFEIVLSDEPNAATFAPEAKSRYLAHTLGSKGELLLSYDAVAHEQLPNGVALLSGQGPTAQTAADCPSYTPLTPATAGPEEQVIGDGCVYPASVKTLPGQLEAKHLRWRAYVQGIDEGAGTPPPCTHPESGAADPTFAAGDYAGFRNPFVYFASIVASPSCASDDVGLATLRQDLSGPASSAPAFSYIVPDRCHDAGPLACSPGAQAGPTTADSLLSQIVPEIMTSKAYKHGGLIVITTDEAPSTGEYADSSSCCGQPTYPNLTTTGLRQGGGGVGALLLSPLIKGGTTASERYNHYSLLKTVEDIFGLSHLGYAALPAVNSFAASLLNAH